MARYNFRETEAKWQTIWAERDSFRATEDLSRRKAYVLGRRKSPSIS